MVSTGVAVHVEYILCPTYLAAIQPLYAELDQGFDRVFSIGTTSVFPYIAGPVAQASQTGIPTVEINPGETHVSRFVDYKLTSGAAVSLRAIRQALQQALN
jgi:NAD-dependent deacetylase